MCILHTRPRVQRAPGIPCALFSRGRNFLHTSDANAPREREHILKSSALCAIAHWGGRSSIPETPMIESIGRSVLDTRIRGYDDLFRCNGLASRSLSRDGALRRTRCRTLRQVTTTMSVSRRLLVPHAAASLSKYQPDSANDPSRSGPIFAAVQIVWLTRERSSHIRTTSLANDSLGAHSPLVSNDTSPRRCDLFAMGPRATRLFNLWG
jgi:hypothetical protein